MPLSPAARGSSRRHASHPLGWPLALTLVGVTLLTSSPWVSGLEGSSRRHPSPGRILTLSRTPTLTPTLISTITPTLTLTLTLALTPTLTLTLTLTLILTLTLTLTLTPTLTLTRWWW